MSHVYYFGNESYKPLGFIELTEEDLSITRIRFSEEDMNDLESIGLDDSFYKNKKYKYDRKFQKVACGKEVVYILDEKGQIWAFGSGSKGQLGLDKSIHKLNKPINIHKYRNALKERIKQIATCHNHTLILTETNKIYGWGDPTSGKLLDIDQNLVLRPTLINQNQFTLPGQTLQSESPTQQNISVLSHRNLALSQRGIKGHTKSNRALANSTSSRHMMMNIHDASFDASVGSVQKITMPKAVSSQFGIQLKNSNSSPPNSNLHLNKLNQRNHSQLKTRETGEGSNIPLSNSSKLLNSQSQLLRLPSIQKHKSFKSLKQSIHLNSKNSASKDSPAAFYDELNTNRSIKQTIFSQIQQQQSQQSSNIIKGGSDPVLLAVGSNHTLVYLNGILYSSGKQNNGLLGIGAIKVEQTTVPLPIQYFYGIKIVGLAANFFHSLAWDEDGNLYSWGEGFHGQLGHPIEKGYSFNKIETEPKRIQTLQGKNVISASCGKYYSAAVTIEGELYGWGKGEYCIKENDDESKNSLIECLYPRKLMPEGSNSIHVKFIQVSCGVSHNAAIDQFGRLYTWGDSSEFCLGHAKQQDLFSPKLVKILKDKVTIDVSCGDRFTVVIQEEDASGRKNINIVDQFKQRNINNIRQKIKSLYDYNKMKMNLGSEQEEKVPEIKPINLNKIDNIHLDQSVSGINLSLSNIDSPLTQRRDRDTPQNQKGGNKKQKRNAKHSSDMRSINNILPQLNNQQNSYNNSSYATRNEFEIDLEEFIDKKNSNQEIELPDSKDSSNNIFKNIKNLFDKNYHNTKTFKAIQENNQVKSMKDFIKKHNKNIKENNLKIVNNGNHEEISIIFDECSEQLAQKEQNDPLYIPFITPTSQTNENQAFFDLNDDGNIKQMSDKHNNEQILSQYSAMQQFLGDLLETKNETLKYEYIEMVRRGLEDNHLFYLISDPKEGVVQNNREREKLKQHLNKKIINYSIMNVEVLQDTKRIIDSQRKYTSTLMNNCRKAQDKAKKVVGKFTKHTGVDPTLLKPNKRYLPLLNVLNSCDNYQQYQEDKIKGQSQQRDERINLAIERREEIFLQKRNAMIKKMEEKSLHYSKEQSLLKDVRQRDFQKKKLVTQYLQVEQMLQFFHGVISQSYKKKQERILQEQKALVIQNSFKKHKVVTKLKLLSPFQLALLREVLKRRIIRRAVRRIYLFFIKFKYEKIIQKKLQAAILNGFK